MLLLLDGRRFCMAETAARSLGCIDSKSGLEAGGHHLVMQEDAQLPSKPHELLPLLLVALKLKGDHCNVAVLNSSSACLALSQTLPAGADEIIAADSHVTRILNAHIGLPVGLYPITLLALRRTCYTVTNPEAMETE